MKKNEERKAGGRAPRKYVISSVVLAFAVAVCLIVTVQTMTRGYVSFFGYSLFRVVTPSMEPTIPTGSILVCKKTPIEDIETGDIVCFKSLQPEMFGAIITHRVVSIETGEDGARLLESRGDANYSSDPYYVRADNLIGRVTQYSGGEGFIAGAVSFLSGKTGFMVFVVIPVLLIAGIILWNLGRNVKKELSATIDSLAKREKRLPGYKTLTVGDYEAIYRKLKNELKAEMAAAEKPSVAPSEKPSEDKAEETTEEDKTEEKTQEEQREETDETAGSDISKTEYSSESGED